MVPYTVPVDTRPPQVDNRSRYYFDGWTYLIMDSGYYSSAEDRLGVSDFRWAVEEIHLQLLEYEERGDRMYFTGSWENERIVYPTRGYERSVNWKTNGWRILEPEWYTSVCIVPLLPRMHHRHSILWFGVMNELVSIPTGRYSSLPLGGVAYQQQLEDYQLLCEQLN